MRIILIIAVNVIAPLGDYYATMPCAKVAFTMGSDELTQALYPACAAYFNGTSPDQWTMVPADFGGTDVVQIAAALDMTAGMALWLAFLLHAVGIEIYVSRFPDGQYHSLADLLFLASPDTRRAPPSPGYLLPAPKGGGHEESGSRGPDGRPAWGLGEVDAGGGGGS